MVKEIVEGADGTDIRAGIIGEIGVSRPITSAEERGLRAAARAQCETGAAISVHFEIGSQPDEYQHVLDVLQSEGADLNRVALGHFICRPDEVSLCRELVARGAYVEFDLFGQEQRPKMPDLMQTPPEVQIASLRWFLIAGLLDRVLISQNICHPKCLRLNRGYGYAHILRNLVPRFRAYGVTDEQVHAIMVENPRRLFPLDG
jgi:phosphotriesterase-related protein